MRLRTSPKSKALLALIISSLTSVGLYIAVALVNHDWEYGWLSWNLALGWVPLLVAIWLLKVLRHKRWSSWQALALSVAWLLFLPNSFYIITDYIHLFSEQRPEFMLDLIMFSSFALNGMILGYASLYLLHRQLVQRINAHVGCWFVFGALLVTSYGMYMGRFLRWNSWDVLVNAPVVLVDVSNSILYASRYEQLLATTVGFFVLLGSLYAVLWYGLGAIQKGASPTSR